jgi:hypothetical protein
MSDKATEPPKKRRLWQFHLSTALVSMLIAGGVLMINFRPPKPKPVGQGYVSGGSLGWPHSIMAIYKFYYDNPLSPEELRVLDDLNASPVEHFNGTAFRVVRNGFSLQSLLFDVVEALTTTIVLASVFEWFIRRREGRKQ